MTDFGLGRLPAVDERDRRFLMAAEPLPQTTRTWRYWTPGPVLDQGSQPHCVGYSVAQWGQTSPTRTFGIDPVAVYRRAQQIDEWPGEGYAGTSVRAGLKVLQEQGRIDRYVWAYDTDVIAQWLLTTGPVMLGTRWTRGMFYPDRHGVCHPTGNNAGGHAYLCIGVNMVSGMFRCVNSWSARWGQCGRFWLLGEDLQRLMEHQGEAAAAIERVATS